MLFGFYVMVSLWVLLYVYEDIEELLNRLFEDEVVNVYMGDKMVSDIFLVCLFY